MRHTGIRGRELPPYHRHHHIQWIGTHGHVQWNTQVDYTSGKAVLAMPGVELPHWVLALASWLNTGKHLFGWERCASSEAYSLETLAGTPQALPELLLPGVYQISLCWLRLLCPEPWRTDQPARKPPSPDKEHNHIGVSLFQHP
jgi:hypothetical protein